jgi:DNA-3-methyladenine glycosylase II
MEATPEIIAEASPMRRRRAAGAAVRHLSSDPRFAALIRRVGPPALAIHRQRSLYEALVRAIAYQQLHSRAAEAILARFAALFPGDAFPEPATVMATADSALRGCGFSAGKIAAIRDICAKALDGTVPGRRESARLTDAALIERLTAIRGVGRWTVEMLLIFTLAAPTCCRWTISACARATAFCTAWKRSPGRSSWRRSALPGSHTGQRQPGICTAPRRNHAGRPSRAARSGKFSGMAE